MDVEMCESNKISDDLRGKATDFLESRKNANNLVEIVQCFDTRKRASECMVTLELIFSELLQRREMYADPAAEYTKAEKEYREWLINAFNQVWDKLFVYLEGGRPNEQKQALSTCMKLIAWEGKYPINPKSNPLTKIRAILIKLISPKKNNLKLIAKYVEYAAYHDVLCTSWTYLAELVPNKRPTEQFVKNFVEVIDKSPVDKLQFQNESTPVMMCGLEGVSSNFPVAVSYKKIKKYINKTFIELLRWNLTPETHKQLLLVLLERILPHLDNPILLTDFLMDSLVLGGPVSILALQGIHHMMQQHNLDYPNFYEILYSMFKPDIFYTKYKSRLFYLSDMFLNSTHLPEKLVAAFAKRLARLTLVAPSEDILIIIMFVGNLIIRHPGLKQLIHMNLNEPKEAQSCDPFVMEELDPYKSNALQSSLWELKVLQSHSLPSIATAARFIDLATLPSVEFDLSSVLDNTSDEIFSKEIKKKANEIVLTFDKPQSLALPRNEILLKCWNLI